MMRWPGRLARFVFWLLTPDSLPTEEADGAKRIGGVGFVRWLISTERLDDVVVDQAPEPPRKRKGGIAYLLASEDLGWDESGAETDSRQPGFLKWIFATEDVGEEEPAPDPAGARPGFWKWLFGTETLAATIDESEPIDRPRGGVPGMGRREE